MKGFHIRKLKWSSVGQGSGDERHVAQGAYGHYRAVSLGTAGIDLYFEDYKTGMTERIGRVYRRYEEVWRFAQKHFEDAVKAEYLEKDEEE